MFSVCFVNFNVSRAHDSIFVLFLPLRVYDPCAYTE